MYKKTKLMVNTEDRLLTLTINVGSPHNHDYTELEIYLRPKPKLKYLHVNFEDTYRYIYRRSNSIVDYSKFWWHWLLGQRSALHYLKRKEV